MNEKPTSIKLLLKYYNNFQDNKYNNILTNSTYNDFNKTESNTYIGNNQNYRYSTNSLMSFENHNNIIKNIDKEKNTTNLSIMSELKQDYLIHFQTNYPYNNLENIYPPKVINIKTCVYLYLVEKKKMNLTLDSLLLFQFIHGKLILLNDEDTFYTNMKSKTQINKNENDKNNKNKIKDINKNIKNNISNSTIIYYSLNKEKIKILVELYSNSIDHISLNISKTCSLLMLKYIIILKLKEIEKNQDISNLIDNISESINNNITTDSLNTITINEIEKKIKIYGNGIANKNFNQYISKKQTNRNFNNSSKISDIYNYYIDNINSSRIKDYNPNNNKMIDNIPIFQDDLNDGILNFIMMEQNNNKCSLGLDFRFNILQSFIPISEEENKAENNNDLISFKSYIKNDSYLSKNGLNLYFNCLNNECKYNSKCFILNAGYGNYDIFSLIKYNAYCPFCYKSKQEFLKEKNKMNNNINENNNLQLKYIGMMNSKWAYKGYLIGIKMTNVEGKGMTVMKDILYKTKEFDFLNQFKRLLFEIERFNSKNIYNPIYSKKDNSICSDNYNNEIDKDNFDLKYDINDAKLNKFCFKEKEITDIFNDIDDNDINNNKYENQSNKIDKYSNLQIKENQNESDKNNIIFNIKNEYYNNNIDNNNSFINNETITNNEYKNINKELDVKSNSNIKKKNNNSKGTYYGNSRQVFQNKDINETNITNVGFNIIIDKTKSNCCETCFDIQHVSQVCSIY